MSLCRCREPPRAPEPFSELAESGGEGAGRPPPSSGGAALQGETDLAGSVAEEGEGVRTRRRQSPNGFLFLQPEQTPRPRSTPSIFGTR